MDFSIGNLNGTNASVSSMISQLIAKKTSSMNSLLEQRTSIENALASLQNSALGTGSINNSYSSQIASLQDTIDAMKNQYTINGNKLNTINSLNKSYNKTVSTLDDYINSLKNPNPDDSYVSGTSSNGNVAGVTVGNSANPQRVELSVTQLATCSVLKSGQILGTAISGKTKITDLFAGTYDSASNTVTSLRTDITADMKLSEIGVTSGSFKLGSRVITVDKDESVGDLINKINSDSNYTAKIDKTTGAFTISATAGNSVAITNAVGDLNVSGDITTTTKLEDIGIKNGAYFVGGVQIDVAEGDTVASLIEKLEAEGFRATLQTDANNPSIKTLNITDSSGNKVNTEASNFASLAGFTVSEGTFSINGETFTIDSDTTIDDLVFQINKATADGVGATFKDGQIILTASKTGAVDIKVEKGTSNFTNAVGFTAGGVMNTGNLVMGSDGSYVALKGLNSGISYSDTAKADGSGKFKTGNFLLSYSKIDEDGNPTSEMLTTEIKIEDGDTIESIIEKIKKQTSQTYTDAEGNDQTNYLQAEIVDGRFQIRQTAKGKGYNISVSAGSSDFTKYVGLTKDVNSGVSISGSSTTYTGINAVTSSTTFKEGNFSITASVANDPSRTETITFDVAENETLQSVMDKINNSGLAIKASLVTMSDGTQHLQLSHNNYGSGYKISVTSGSSDFTNVVGFTSTVSSGISTDGTNSTLTGTVGNLDLSKTGYTNGSFVISTNKLSADGKTPSSEMASAVIEVDSSMSLQDIMDKINSATYKDADGNDVNMGLRASLTADGKIQIKQVNGGEGFDIKIEAGDTNFTQEVGLTKSVSVGVSAGATSSYVLGTKVYDGTFTEGSFKVTTNKVGDDGNASSEMVSVDVKIEAGKTLAESLDSINAQLNSIGLSASIVAEGENAGKIKIEQLNAGSGFDIKIESGTTDFTEKVGLTTQVSTGVSNEGTYAYVKGEKALTETAGYSAGDFIVYTNKTDSEGNPLDEMQSVVVSLQAGLSAENAVKSINNQISSIGLSATIEDGKIKISQTNAGSGFDIKIEAGTTNFTEKAGLTKTVSVGTSTTGTASSITGNNVVTGNELADAADGTKNDFTTGSFTITAGKNGVGKSAVITVESGDTVNDVIDKINNSGLDVTALIDENGKFVIKQNNTGSDYFVSVEAGNTNFTQFVGITANVTTGTSNPAHNATLTGNKTGLTLDKTFTDGSFIITTNDVTYTEDKGYFADPTKILSTTIKVEEGDTLQQVLDKINQQGASIGISASLTDDRRIQIKQLNAGTGFSISVVGGYTNFTSEVGLTTEATSGVSSSGSYTNISGSNTVSGSDSANDFVYDFVIEGGNTVSDTHSVSGADFTAGDFTITVNHPDVGYGVDYTITVDEADTVEDVLNKINNTVEALDFSIKDGKLYSASEGPLGLSVEFTSGTSNFVEYAGLNKLNKIDRISEDEASQNGYVAIHSAQELIDAIGTGASTLGKTFVLMNDIDFSGIEFSGFSQFNGTLDGNGYKIKNLSLIASGREIAFFHQLDDATVKNLYFEDVNLNADNADYAAVIASRSNMSHIENVVIDGVSQIGEVNGTRFMGVVAARTDNDVVIKDILIRDVQLHVNSSSASSIYIGGLVGLAANTSVENVSIDNTNLMSFSSGNQSYIGGLFGGAQSVNVFGTYVDAGMFASSGSAGMLAGRVADSVFEFSIIDGNMFGSSGSGVTAETVAPVGSSSAKDILTYLADHDSLKDFSNGLFMSNSLASTFDELGGPGISTSLTQRTATANGQFNEGTFTITAGLAGSEVTKTIEVEGGDTIDDIITKINNSGLGVTASITADGKFVINSDSTDANFRIKVESGSSDFLEYVGMVSETTSTGILSPGSDVNQFTTLTGNNYVGTNMLVSAGSFKINDITINFGNGSLIQALNKINTYTDQTGVIAELVVDSSRKYHVALRAAKTGADQTIYVEGGTSNFGVVTGLTTQAIGGGVALGTEGKKQTITGSNTVVGRLTESEAIEKGYKIIKTVDDLKQIANASQYDRFILMGDIDLAGFSGGLTVGSNRVTLDGNGYTLKNYDSDIALFSSVNDYFGIENLIIDDFHVTNDGASAALLINSQDYSGVSLEDIYVTNSNVEGYSDTGALIANSSSTSASTTIKNVIVDEVTVQSTGGIAGGFIGYSSAGDINIMNSTFAGFVAGLDSAGGFIGHSSGVSVIIQNSASSGGIIGVEGGSGAAGGFIGTIVSGNAIIHKSFMSTLTVVSAGDVGVFVGSDEMNLVSLLDSYYDTDKVQFATSTTNPVLEKPEYDPEKTGEALKTGAFDKYKDLYVPGSLGNFTNVSDGTVIINGTTITLTSATGSMLIDDAIEQINAKSAQTGVTAEIRNGKVVFTGNSAFTVAEGTSDFVKKTGTAGYTINAAADSTIGATVNGAYGVDKMSQTDYAPEGYTAISSAAEFYSKINANKSGKFILTKDIDFSGYSYAGITNFAGVLEGNGYTLKNFSGTSSSSKALFSSTSDGAVIRNLHISNFKLNYSSGYQQGLLVNSASGSFTFENIDISNSSITYSSGQYIGGLVGYAAISTNSVGTFKNINFGVNVNIGTSANSYVGALAGCIANGSFIVENVSSMANIAGSANVGGLFGQASGSSAEVYIKNTDVTGRIASATSNVGGFIGYSASNVNITNSISDVSMNGIQNSSSANMFIGTSSGTYTRTFKNAYYNRNYSDGLGENGTAVSPFDLNVLYNEIGGAYQANWGGAYKIQMTEAEAVAKGYTVIKTASEFISKINANKSGKFMLMADLDFSGISYSYITGFTGTLDGNGYSIKNVSNSTTGLFLTTGDGAVIRNLTLDGFEIGSSSLSNGYGAALVGRVQGSITIENINLKNSNIYGIYAGGLVALVDNTVTNAQININNITVGSDVNIVGEHSAGIISQVTTSDSASRLVIRNVISEAIVMGKPKAGDDYKGNETGGIVGRTSMNTFIYNVFVGGEVGGNAGVGGIIGMVTDNSNTTKILNAYTNSKITYADTFGIGAIVGTTPGSNTTIANSMWTNTKGATVAVGNGTATTSGVTSTTAVSIQSQKNILQYKHIVGSDYKTFSGTLQLSALNYGGTLRATFNDATIGQIINKINNHSSFNGKVEARLVDGKLQILSTDGVTFRSISTSGNMNSILGIDSSAAKYNIKTGSVQGLHEDMKLDGLSGGYLKIGVNASTHSIYINNTDTIGSIITKLNSSSANIEAGLDSSGRLYIKYRYAGNYDLSIDFSDTNFDNLVGLSDTATKYENNAVTSTRSTLTGSVNVTGNETLNAGSFAITMSGGAYKNFTVNQGETINTVIQRINDSNFDVTAAIENGKVVLTSRDNTVQNIGLKEISGNFGTVSGLATITNIGGESIVGTEGSYTKLTGSTSVSTRMTVEEARAQGYTIITSASQLSLMENSSGKFFLANDITITSPNDLGIKNFSGTFNGNGNTIYYGAPAASAENGLFNDVSGNVTIENLTLSGFHIETIDSYAGFLIGNAGNSSGLTINNIKIEDSILISSTNYVGGLVGSVLSTFGNINVSNISIDDTNRIEGYDYVGGLFGALNSNVANNIIFENIDLYADIKANDYIGGIIGYVNFVDSIEMKNINSDASYTSELASGAYVGGLIGCLYDGTLYVNNIHSDVSDVNVKSSSMLLGGLTGYLDSVDAHIEFALSANDVKVKTNNSIYLSDEDVGYSITGSGIFDATKLDYYSDPYTKVTAGTITINGKSITLSAGYIDKAIEQINSYSSTTGVKASIENGKVVFTNTQTGNNGITITEGTSNFVDITGTAGYTVTSAQKASSGGTVTGQTINSTHFTEAEAVAMGYTVIKTASDFWYAINSNKSGKFMLMADLDFSTVTFSSISGFSGILDGNGYRISDIDSTNPNNFGIFSSTKDGAQIRNLKIRDVNFEANTYTVGLLVGSATGTLSIENIDVASSKVEISGDEVGLIGLADNDSQVNINNVKLANTVTFSANSWVGSIIGRAEGIINITNVDSAAVIEGQDYSGGIIGSALDGTATIHMDNIYYHGTIKSTLSGAYLGGIIGHAYLDNSGTTLMLSNIYAQATFNTADRQYVQQILGILENSSTSRITTKNVNYDKDKGNSSYGTGLTSSTLTNSATGRNHTNPFYESVDSNKIHMSEADALAAGYKVIHNAQEFISTIAQDGANGKYMLMGDIDFSGVSYTALINFGGILDGNGYTIRNLTNSTNGQGLIHTTSKTSKAVIRNLTLDNFNITNSTSGGYASALIGGASGDVLLENIKLDNSTITSKGGDTWTAGLIANIANANQVIVTMNNIYVGSNVTINSTAARTAGVVASGGYNSGAAKNNMLFLSNVESYATVKSTHPGAEGTAQILGWTCSKVVMNNIKAGGSVTASSGYVGGILGCSTNSDTYLTNVYTAATLSGGRTRASIAGYMFGGKITGAYNTDKVWYGIANGSYTTGSSTGGITASAYDSRTSGPFYTDVYDQITAGSIRINATNINLTAGSIASAIEQINKYSSTTHVTAYIDNENRVVFNSTSPSYIVQIQEGTSNFYDKAISTSNSSVIGRTSGIRGSVTGLTHDTKFDNLTDGTLKIYTGSKYININYHSNMTVGDLIDEIMSKSDGVLNAGLNANGQILIKSTDSFNVASVTADGNLANLLGLTYTNSFSNNATVTYGEKAVNSTLTGTKNVSNTTSVSAGDFNINYKGNSYKVSVGNRETINSVIDKINSSNWGLTASIVNNKVVITADEANSERITVTDGTSNFSEIAGFTAEGAQSGTTVKGVDSTLTSANTAVQASGAYSGGDFFIHLTDLNGDIQSTENITINASDTIEDIIEKINSSNAGVTAYIDKDTGKMVLKRDSSDTAGGILVTKGTSDFTNKIGFTSGGEQLNASTNGQQAELISTADATPARFTDGVFLIQMTDKDGNVVSEHEISVSRTDTAADIAEKINDANIGLTAYIDEITDKMVIRRDSDNGEGGFVLQKGTTDFTNVMGFTSGGASNGVFADGEDAVLVSTYDIRSAGSFSAGTFYIDGVEITITADDITSGNAIQNILDRISDLTDVTASIDGHNRIVLTKKPSAGEGPIEVVKGTSDFTNKFGFTSGGYETGSIHTGNNATLISKELSLDTVVSEGYFYIERTGNNPTDAPVKIDIAANSTISDVIDKINSLNAETGVTASWDSSANKIILTRDSDTGEGGINVIKGTTDFTNIAGFTSGGEQYVPTIDGVTASVTGANKVAQNTVVSKGDFVIKLDNTEHVITLDTDTTIEAVMEKINAIDGLTAVYDDNTKKITITRDGASGAGSIEIIKGTSDFTNIAGFTSGGSQTATVVQGSKASITSVNKVDDTTKFTAGDFVINVKGETNKSININIDDDDTILSIVDKINADKDSGIFASFDAATGKITISLGAELGDSSIEIVKGSSNFTNVVGFTTGGSSNGVFQDGDTAEIISGNSAASNQHFTEGDFTIKLTGNVPAGQDSEFKINVTANDTLQTIVDKINALDKGVYAFINDDNKLVIRRDADYGSGGIEIIKGTSSFTTDMGITSGGEEFDSLVNAGSSSKIISTQDVATAEGAYTDGNFFIQLLDKNGNAQGGLIQVDINKTGNSVDSISTIINTINSMNAGVTASIENGKFVLTRNQDTEAGSLTVIKGTSDFTNVLGLTSGGNLQDGVYESGEAATNTVLTSKDLGKKLVSDSMTLGSIGVKNGTFKINGVDINVKASDTIYDLASRINSVFSNSAYEDIAVSASYENGELVLRSKNASSTARIVVEKGTTNFTDIAQLTRDYQNSVDLGIEKTGQNAHFNINGKDYDMALDLNDKGQNMIYLDDNGNVLDSSEGASIAINVKQTGNTTIDIGRNLLNDSVEKLQSFVNRFNTAMDAAANPIMSDDTAFNSFINQIKNALTNNIGSINKVTTKLAEIGIIVKITGGNNSNMGSVQISLSKTNGQYDYVEAFYKDPQKVLDLIIGDDSAPLDHNIAGSFVRLSDVLHNALENNRNGYFKITPRSIEAQQKALKREITSTTFDLNELKNTAAGTNEMQGLSEYLLQLEQQYQLINEAIIALNSQYSSSITRLVLNKNNASFKPLVS